MGNKCKRIEIDKDRGDLPRKLNIKEVNRVVNVKSPDLENSKGKQARVQNTDIKEVNRVVNVKSPDLENSKGKQARVQNTGRARSSSPRLPKRKHNKDLTTQATNTSLDVIIIRNQPEGPKTIMAQYVDYRKRIRDRYTKRSKDFPKISLRKDKDDKSGDVLKHTGTDPVIRNEKSKEPFEKISDKSIKIPKRKPIIKTITSKKDAVRVFKAVTFTDQPKKETLHIKLPRSPVKKAEVSRIPKRIKTLSVTQIEQKPKKKVKVKPRFSSPECIKSPSFISSAKIVSPPTEVARWCPSEKHTMPYYEAWVDTTLAAISKFSTKDKQFLEKQNILDVFKTQLQFRPELYNHDFDDERYTGKITVKQK